MQKKAFGHPPLIVFQLGGVVSANTGPDAIAIVYEGHPATLRRMRRSCRNFRFMGGSGTAALIRFGHLPPKGKANKKKNSPQALQQPAGFAIIEIC